MWLPRTCLARIIGEWWKGKRTRLQGRKEKGRPWLPRDQIYLFKNKKTPRRPASRPRIAQHPHAWWREPGLASSPKETSFKRNNWFHYPSANKQITHLHFWQGYCLEVGKEWVRGKPLVQGSFLTALKNHIQKKKPVSFNNHTTSIFKTL